MSADVQEVWAVAYTATQWSASGNARAVLGCTVFYCSIRTTAALLRRDGKKKLQAQMPEYEILDVVVTRVKDGPSRKGPRVRRAKLLAPESWSQLT